MVHPHAVAVERARDDDDDDDATSAAPRSRSRPPAEAAAEAAGVADVDAVEETASAPSARRSDRSMSRSPSAGRCDRARRSGAHRVELEEFRRLDAMTSSTLPVITQCDTRARWRRARASRSSTARTRTSGTATRSRSRACSRERASDGASFPRPPRAIRFGVVRLRPSITPLTPTSTPPSPSVSPLVVVRRRSIREHFRCFSGELPDVASLSSYAGLVVTGSHHGVNDGRGWIDALRLFLAEACDPSRGVRVLGVCFGCQILAQALGGAAGKNPRGDGGFTLKRERVTCHRAMLERDDYQSAAASFPSSSADSDVIMTVFESHGDAVTSLPPSATTLATSATAPHEIWSRGDNVLAWQGHPELSADAIVAKIVPHVSSLSERQRDAGASSSSHWFPYDRVRSRGGRRFLLRTLLPGVRFSPPITPRFQSRHTATPHNSASDAFQLRPDFIASNDGMTLSGGGLRDRRRRRRRREGRDAADRDGARVLERGEVRGRRRGRRRRA